MLGSLMWVGKAGMWEGAEGTTLTPTCCWILLLKYFWMSLRLVAEQRSRWVSSDCGEDKRWWLRPTGDCSPGTPSLGSIQMKPLGTLPCPQHPFTRKVEVWRVSSGSPQPSAWKHSSRLWGEGCC